MESPPAPALSERASAYMLPASLVLAWVAAVLAQRFNAPTLGSEFAAAALAIPLFVWALRKHRLDRSRVMLLSVASLPVTLMLVSALRTTSPTQAILGSGPLWQGWILWASALGWLWVAVAAADGRDLHRVAKCLIWLGSITAVWALMEAAGLVSTYQERTGLAAMAFFDSPSSMAQALTVTISATVSLLVRKNTGARVRLGYGLLLLLQLSAVFAAGARAALLGLVIGVAAYGVIESERTRLSRGVRLVSAIALVSFVVGTGVVSAAWSGALGPHAFSRADHLLSGRFAIWQDVGERLESHSALGVGSGPFDSVITWNVLADGRVTAELTYDQHSILLTWLMDTGAVGFLAFGFAAVVLGIHIVRSAYTTSSARALAAGGVALFVAMLSSWPEPLALISVSVIVGSLVSNGSLRTSHPEHRFPLRAPVIALPTLGASIATAITLVALVPAVNARLTTAHAPSYPDLVARIERALVTTHDYGYLTSELTLIERQGALAVSDAEALDMLRSMAASYPVEAEGRMEIPLLALEILWERSAYLSEDEFWNLSRFYADKGLAADPSAGVWKYSLARAAAVGHRADASKYLKTALAADIPESASIYLRHLP